MVASNAERQKAYRARRNVTSVTPVTEPALRNVTPELIAAVDAWAAAQGCTRHEAVAKLIERGLLGAEEARHAALADLARRRATAAVQRAQGEAREKFFGKTALGDPLPARGAYQKGQTKAGARR